MVLVAHTRAAKAREVAKVRVLPMLGQHSASAPVRQCRRRRMRAQHRRWLPTGHTRFSGVGRAVLIAAAPSDLSLPFAACLTCCCATVPAVLQTLGVTIQLLKLVLFAQLAAVFGSSGAQSALWQVLPLLALICLYWAYVRVFVPMAHLADAVAEVSALQCTGGSGWRWHAAAAGRSPALLCLLERGVSVLVAVLPSRQPLQQTPRMSLPGFGLHPPPNTHTSPTIHRLLQAISCACDLGTLVCGVVVASLPSTAIHTL